MDHIKHNERFDSVFVMFIVNGKVMQTATIRDAIIWRQDAETIDIAEYGQNLPNMILMLDRTKLIERQHKDDRKRLHLQVELS